MNLNLTLFDALVLGVVLLSAIMAFARGLLREVVSIASLVVGVLAVIVLLPLARKTVGPLFPANTPVWICDAIMIAVLFTAAFAAFGVITGRVRHGLLQSDTITAVDRSAGFVFGAVRGLVVLGLGLMLLNSLIAQDLQPKWVKEAKLYPTIQSVTKTIIAIAPTPQQATRAIHDSAESAKRVGEDIASGRTRELVKPATGSTAGTGTPATTEPSTPAPAPETPDN